MTGTPPGQLPLPVVPGLSDLSVFARGGYATVYRAVQESVGREVAVKVENRTLDSDRDQRRFLREARAAGRMSSHPHVVDLFDAGVTADRHPYLIMELCDGSYAERMRSSPLGPAEARDVGAKIADALADAHELGVLHRDVKPANILHSRFGEPALADFGLAVIAEYRDTSLTLEVLTPAYAPPEMFRHSEPTPSSDVYALCATIYAIMHGKPPRWQTDQSPSIIALLELFSQPLPDLPGVPAALLDVLRAGMANDPDARPTAAQLRDVLLALPLDTGQAADGPARLGPVSPWAPPSGPPADANPSKPPISVTYQPAGPYESGFAAPGTHQAAGPPPHPPTGGPRPAGPGDPHGGHPATMSPRRRKLPWVLGVFGVLVLLVMVSAGTWWVATRPEAAPTPTPTASMSTDPGGIGPTNFGGALPGCLIPLPDGARCPGEMECFGDTRTQGGRLVASRVPCTGPHTWETYAIGDLPADVAGADHATIVADPAVRRLCNTTNLLTTSLMLNLGGWQLEVLPPTPEAVAAGDLSYRCLAGRGPDQLDRPTLGG
ncbi:protein kinase domain-containing protein [Polymorphospora lycopeni]|uniref:non-specific serine/threonine protein kinase n=1 Tax=Polymorphospora lycopeni TaxID=3140240 RepID=A0ABV5CX57_9ACTN